MTALTVLLSAALVASTCFWFFEHRERRRLEAAAAELKQEAADLEQKAAAIQANRDGEIAAQEVVHQSLREALSGAKIEAARLDERLIKAEEAAATHIALLTNTQEQLELKFRALASEALQNNSQQFLDRTRDQLEHLVRPVGESLQLFQARVQELELARTGAYEGIRAQIQSLSVAQKDLQQCTDQLKNALRNPSQRGRWGELQLRRTVELAGMIEHCDFRQQETLFGDRLRRPDMVVKLPNGREIVVDAKVSMDAYLRALEAEEGQRDQFMAQHASQVRTHVKSLSEKTYWDGLEGSPELVIAFLPLESLYSAALERDPELLNFGVERRVLLATPTTLIALLFAVAYGWRERQLAQNAEEIRETGSALYKNLLTLHSRVVKLGGALNTAVTAYNDAVTSLDGRVLTNARKLHELKAATGAEIDRVETLDVQTKAMTAGDWVPEEMPRKVS